MKELENTKESEDCDSMLLSWQADKFQTIQGFISKCKTVKLYKNFVHMVQKKNKLAADIGTSRVLFGSDFNDLFMHSIVVCLFWFYFGGSTG